MVFSSIGKIIIFFIKGYQFFFSGLFGPCCRFYPSCSQYAILAVEKHGPFRGLILASRRLLSCHPFNPGGYDPVP